MQKIDEASRRAARSRTPTACLQCQKRKQKCSREQPCRHCSRRYPPVECIYTFEGGHRTAQLQSPNRLFVPDDSPVSFYTESKNSRTRLFSALSPQDFSSTAQSYAFHKDLEQNRPQDYTDYLTTFAPTNSEFFGSQSSYQVPSSSVLPSPSTGSYAEPEFTSSDLDFPPLPPAPTNTPNGILNYGYLGGLNSEERWDQSTNQNIHPGMGHLQSFNQSYFVPISMQTESSQPFDVGGSQTFHTIDGMTDHEQPDMSFSSETSDNRSRNRDSAAADHYPGSFY